MGECFIPNRIGGESFCPPPELIKPYSATEYPVVSDENWTGSGIQRLQCTDEESSYFSIPSRCVTNSNFCTNCLSYFNLRPKIADGKCTLYTPCINIGKIYGNKQCYIVKSDDYTNKDYPLKDNQIELCWNPIRKTYQCVIPNLYTEIGLVKAEQTAKTLTNKVYNGEDVIEWKFQSPVNLRIGSFSGIHQIVGKDDDGNEVITWCCQNDDSFRQTGVYRDQLISFLFSLFYNGNVKWEDDKKRFRSWDSLSLTALRIPWENTGYFYNTAIVTNYVQLCRGILDVAETDTYL